MGGSRGEGEGMSGLGWVMAGGLLGLRLSDSRDSWDESKRVKGDEEGSLRRFATRTAENNSWTVSRPIVNGK